MITCPQVPLKCAICSKNHALQKARNVLEISNELSKAESNYARSVLLEDQATILHPNKGTERGEKGSKVRINIRIDPIKSPASLTRLSLYEIALFLRFRDAGNVNVLTQLGFSWILDKPEQSRLPVIASVIIAS